MAVSHLKRYARYLSLLLLTLVFVLLYQFARSNQTRVKSWLAVRNIKPTVVVSPLEQYMGEIKPVLMDRCYSCHNDSQQRGGLRMDTVAGLLKGGDSGPAIVPGKGNSSLLVAVLRGEADCSRMPPQGPMLSETQITRIERWINDGAKGPADEQMANQILAHWSFSPLKKTAIPEVRQKEWVKNPIDSFILARLEEKGLRPNSPVSKDLLLRRVYLDLVGLPPTPGELHAFLADSAPDAYEKVVDRLLASPGHAERWARHWMDIWRYSDSDGRKAKMETYWSSEFIWRWRDWIIRSLHADRGYDQMVMEMLAGDELAPEDVNALEGTGFLARNLFRLSRNVWLTNTIEHTSKAFLGLTMNCARCHDHRLDPVTQKEYYRFRAFFEPHDIRVEQKPVPGSAAPAGLARAYDADPDRQTFLFRKGDEMNPDKSVALKPGVPAFLGGDLQNIPIFGQPGRDKDGKATEPEKISTGRRLALARWIVDPANPLTARVAVNHIWTHHFGVGFVETPADLGMRTKAPIHREMLDYLASQLIANQWTMKQLHRMIVTSRFYQMQSTDDGSQEHSLDPDNHYWWRYPSHRMEAEVVRDSLLHLAGKLDLTQGGPSLPLTEESEGRRRSLYYRYSREDRMEFLDTFDSAKVEECYRRIVSVVPQQSLALLNSPFAWNQARAIAGRIEAKDDKAFVSGAFEAVLCRKPAASEEEACLKFLTSQREALQQPDRLTPFPGAADAMPPEPMRGARESLVHVLINHHDFVTIR